MSKVEGPLTLISATPSPFARMNRIAMALKGIPFELQNEIPWETNTQTPKYNPLEKLPILLFPDGRPPVYDSAHIQEYIFQNYADKQPKLLTGDIDLDLQARQIQVLSERMVKERKAEGKEYLVGDKLAIADIAAVCAVGHIDFSGDEKGWMEKYPTLAEWWKGLDAKKEFVETKPVVFDLEQNIV